MIGETLSSPLPLALIAYLFWDLNINTTQCNFVKNIKTPKKKVKNMEILIF